MLALSLSDKFCYYGIFVFVFVFDFFVFVFNRFLFFRFSFVFVFIIFSFSFSFSLTKITLASLTRNNKFKFDIQKQGLIKLSIGYTGPGESFRRRGAHGTTCARCPCAIKLLTDEPITKQYKNR